MYTSLGLTWVGISYLFHQYLFSDKTDRRKIDAVFKNIRYGFKDQFPKLIFKRIKNDYSVYGYSLPYGLIDSPKIEEIISKTLNKSVEISMSNGNLIIKVYNNNLKTRYSYSWEISKSVPIGYSQEGVIYHDFDEIPHMTIAGMTRQGKTVFLKLILAHILNNDESAEVFILDLKGGLEFGRYAKLKQVREIADDVEKANTTLDRLLSDMDNDMASFKRRGYNNILNTGIKRRTYIVIDEAAELDKYSQNMLSKIARIGGALGYRVIFATQYPTADTLPRQIKQNSDAKISFRLPTATASRVAIDETGAEQLEYPGRAIYRTHDRKVIQVPYITDKEIEEKLRRFKVDSSKEENTEAREDFIEFE